MAEQLKQIMKYSLGIHVSKSNNFYELCEDLSKYLLNIWKIALNYTLINSNKELRL
jgi:hypothetical protein